MKRNELILSGSIILLASIVIRLPFFFPAVLDWDESTYILMSQSVLDGHLPYVELWDNKPPFIFYLIALFIILFGKSIVAVRTGAALCVAISAFFLYLIARRFLKVFTSLFAAILYIFGSSFLLSGQSVLSEHLALAFLMPALYLYFTDYKIVVKFLLIGLLMALASFIRTNLGIVSAVFGIYVFLFYLLKKQYKIWFKAILGYASGFILITLILVIPYLINNKFDLWWQSVIKAPLAYCLSQYTILQVFKIHGSFIISHLLHPAPVNTVSVLIIITGLTGIVLFFMRWRKYSLQIRQDWLFLFMIFLTIYISILVGGSFWPKYFVQIMPFMSLSTVFIISLIPKLYIRWSTISLIIAFLMITSKDLIFEYKQMLQRYINKGKAAYGPAYEIKSYLEKNRIRPEQTFLMTQHIVYWLMNGKPLEREVTHPSNIYLDYLLKEIASQKTTPLQLMQKILSKDPEVIVVSDRSFFYEDPDADSLLLKTLDNKYYLDRTIKEPVGQTLIFRKDHYPGK